MQRSKMRKAVLFAGVSSGSGKTTVVTGILSALKRRGVDVSAFKCGPDYIDPMFHRRVLGLPSFNLDPFFLEPDALREAFITHSREYSVIEGVMGYYDGVGTAGDYSTYTVAHVLDIPVILIVDASGMATSAGALLKGFQDFRPDSGIVGVIFNQCSPMMYPFLRKVAADVGVEAFGFLPSEKGISIESRYLGLRTDVNSAEMMERLENLGELAERHIDLDGILKLSAERNLSVDCLTSGAVKGSNDDAKNADLSLKRNLVATAEREVSCCKPIIAVARDEAFCFLYEENIEILRECGAEIRFFSPLADSYLPPETKGIYLPGGYPELYLERLSRNKSMLKSIRELVGRGTPTVAECGGFMYLHREIDGFPMAGVIEGKAFKTERLQRFGYITITANKANLLCEAGESIRSHEFHYYDSTNVGSDFDVVRARGGEPYTAGIATESMYAGFPHLYFAANPVFAENFVRASARFNAESV